VRELVIGCDYRRAVRAAARANTAPCSAGDLGDVLMNSWCVALGVVDERDVGEAHAASVAVSPGWLFPASTTAAMMVPAQFQQRHGRPMSLLRFPSFASVGATRECARRIARSSP